MDTAGQLFIGDVMARPSKPEVHRGCKHEFDSHHPR